jgi:hypothetical protein
MGGPISSNAIAGQQKEEVKVEANQDDELEARLAALRM